jgi:hypothetical protein
MRNSVVLPAPLAPMTPTMPPGGSLNDRSSIAVAFLEMVEVDDVLPEALGHRNGDLRHGVGLGIGDLEQFVITLVARLGLGLARFWRRLYPFALAGQRALARLVLARFLLKTLLFLRQPGGVIALVGNAAAMVELEDPAGDIVEEVSIMSHNKYGAGIIAQMAFQPVH